MNHIQEVANRLQGLRDALDLSVEEFATDCGVTPQEYTNYETCVKDIPVSFLHRIAAKYGIELTALLFGEEPKMQSYFVTRAGKGVKVERTKAYSYQDLAAGFSNRVVSPFIVTVEPVDADKPMTMNSHQGQEFNYVLQGKMEIVVDGKSTILNAGDSIMFDATLQHGMRTVGGETVKFLAIIS
ncbi:MAG: helix-turn-helix transcriptional regulator [Muribaculaceae bacterium]|nr:helix-turn-helix transcriptional regulator [Muribaculaceae bacterium]